MLSNDLLGPWVRRFLMEHLIADRNLAPNTQGSYRDLMLQLLPFVAADVKKSVDRLSLDHVSPDLVRRFLRYLEEDRGCRVSTRNQRLAAIHAWARFVGEHSPQHVAWCTGIRAIPFKKTVQPVMDYLEKAEMDALLAAPDQQTAQGLRDYSLLLFLYNTGTRASETAQSRIADLDVGPSASVRITGKGGKIRLCPLWPLTVSKLIPLIKRRDQHERLFLNRRGQPITRFGIHALVKRCARQASESIPSLVKKRVSPHTIRHTTAVHLLRSGVDINTIRAWLGHVSLDTTHVYAEIDLEMKAKALAHCEIPGPDQTRKKWRDNPGMMEFLRSL
ncbi:MAG: site-specific integrase [Candidatus Eisenbacteria bacterium]|nr:site-specific integrase [Candidatus Eisenbacteria bacterium]